MLLISKNELDRPLTGLNRVAPRKHSLAILRFARLQTLDRQTVTLTATDLDETLTCRIKVSDAPEGLDTLLPVAEVKSFIKGDKRAMLQIEPIAAGGVSITEDINGQTLTQVFPAMKVEDFPLILELPEQLFDVPADFIGTAAKIAQFVNPEYSRTPLHGIQLTAEGLTTPDGKQLCHVPYPLPLEQECILRLPTCLFPANMHGPTKLGVVIVNEISRVTIETGQWTWTGRSPAGRYPNWKQVVPPQDTIDWKAELDKAGVAQLNTMLLRQPDDEAHKLFCLELKDNQLVLLFRDAPQFNNRW